jgi:hypothetical protein
MRGDIPRPRTRSRTGLTGHSGGSQIRREGPAHATRATQAERNAASATVAVTQHGRHVARLNRWISTDDAAPRPREGARRGSGASNQGAGGAGPGLSSDWDRPRCARILRITAGSCGAAIGRSRPPRSGHGKTLKAGRAVGAARVRPRAGLFSPRPSRSSAPECARVIPRWARNGDARDLGTNQPARNYLEGMVDRDGIEPPTPGFSVHPGSPDHPPLSTDIVDNQTDGER